MRDQGMLALWESSREEVMKRLEDIEDAVAVAIMTGLHPQDPSRQAAARAAHRMIGIGSFGFPTVAGYMRMVEQVLSSNRIVGGQDAHRLADALSAVRVELEQPPVPEGSGGERRSYTPPGQRMVDVAVVEDDPVHMSLLRHVLEKAGYVIAEFTSGTEAAAALSGPDPTVVPRVALLDVDLPGRSGVSLLRELHDTGAISSVRVIMCTGRGTQGDIHQAQTLGAYGYISKPFDIANLVATVGRAIGDR